MANGNGTAILKKVLDVGETEKIQVGLSNDVTKNILTKHFWSLPDTKQENRTP